MFINCIVRMTQETFCHSLLTFMLFKTSIKHKITDEKKWSTLYSKTSEAIQ